MPRSLALRSITLALIMMVSACSTLAPEPPRFLEDASELSLHKDGRTSTFRIQASRNWEGVVIDDVEWLVHPSSAATSDEEARYLRAELHRLLEDSARPAVAPTATGTLLIRAAITDVAIPSVPLNVFSTALLFVPIERGGAAVEIEAVDLATGRRVAALSTSNSGEFLPLRANFSRLGHATAALALAAQQFEELLASQETPDEA